MIIKPWLCYQWPWNYTDNMNVKRIILTSISNYEKEEKKKTHYIRGQTKEIKESNIKNEEDGMKENLLNNNNIINSENIISEKNNESFGDENDNKKSEKKKYVELSDMQEKNN